MRMRLQSTVRILCILRAREYKRAYLAMVVHVITGLAQVLVGVIKERVKRLFGRE